MPETAVKLESVPPVVVTSLAVKVVDGSLREKVMVSVPPALTVPEPALVIRIVGVTVSTVIVYGTLDAPPRESLTISW